MVGATKETLGQTDLEPTQDEIQAFTEGLNTRFKSFFMADMEGVFHIAISKTVDAVEDEEQKDQTWEIEYSHRRFKDGSGSEGLRFRRDDENEVSQVFLTDDTSKYKGLSDINYVYYGRQFTDPTNYGINSRDLMNRISEIADLLMPQDSEAGEQPKSELD